MLYIGIRLVVVALLLVTGTAPAAGQWLTRRTPNVPRNSDGTPNLAAPPARVADGRPDLQGVWVASRTLITPPDGIIQPWAQALIHEREERFFRDRPSFRCFPNGPEVNPTDWKRIVQTPSIIAILNDNLTYRMIFLDGRSLESDPERTWMGYSVGRWEGDTLVVESFGFNDRTWLNPVGLPHTAALRITERYTRRTYGQMDVDLTITDPEAFKTAWTASIRFELRVDTEMLESVCESNSDSWVGSAAEARSSSVHVAPDILARYVGVYSGMWGTTRRTVQVTLSDGILHANGILGEDVQLIPQSQVMFMGRNGLMYEFAGTDRSAATSLMERHASGDYRYDRQR